MSILSLKNPNFRYWLLCGAFLCGFLLSVVSWLEICIQYCSANIEYRLFGMPFGIVGMGFFSLLFISQFFSKQYRVLDYGVHVAVALSLGAEIMFIGLQKFEIGQWCPICLAIAFCLLIAAIAIVAEFFSFKLDPNHESYEEAFMFEIKRGITSFLLVIVGFLMAFVGVSKPNSLEAVLKDMQTELAFGNTTSQVKVYFISDWFCDSCKAAEPIIEKALPLIQSKATIYFIDLAVHQKSLNFSPYNLAFMMNDKSHYLKARHMLFRLADKTSSPTDEEVMEAASKAQLTFKELTYVDVKKGLEFFDSITDKYKIISTPTIVITNPRLKKVTIIKGKDGITTEKIVKAVDGVK